MCMHVTASQPTPDDLLVSREVCRRCRISIAPLNRYVRDGKIKAIYFSARCRRFEESAVNALLGRGSASGAAQGGQPYRQGTSRRGDRRLLSEDAYAKVQHASAAGTTPIQLLASSLSDLRKCDPN